MMSALLEKKTSHVPAGTGEDMSHYLQEIRQIPLLTLEEERELARRCAEGDEEAVRLLVSANLRLVVSIAREYAGRGVPLLDLVQDGSIGLLIAAKKFDYTREYRFSTYATKWIRQGVTRSLMNHAGLIRVPAYTAERMRKLLRAKSALLQESGEEPTAEELAENTGFSTEKIRKLMELVPDLCSLDVPVGEDEDGSLAELIEDVHALQPQEELIRRELAAIMNELLQQLNDRQRLVLRLRFGMEDGICHSFESIGTQLQISKQRARQIAQEATEKLKKLGTGLGLEDFLA